MFGEDLDFCFRIKKAGYDVIYHPGATIIHYKGESVKSAPYDMIEMFYLSLYKFYDKHYNEFSAWKYFNSIIYAGIFLRKIIAHISVHQLTGKDSINLKNMRINNYQ